MISPAISKASRDVTSRRNHRGTKARFTSGPAVGGAQAPGVGDGRIVPEMTWERLGSPTSKTCRKSFGAPGPMGISMGFWLWQLGFLVMKKMLRNPRTISCGCLWSTVKKNGILVHFYRQLWLPDDHLKWFSCQNNLTSKCFKYFIEFCCREILIFVQTSLLDRSLQQILVAKTRAQYTNHIQIWLTIHGHVVEAAWELMQSWIAKGDVGIAWHCHLCWQGHRTLLRCIGTRHA